MPQPTVYIKRIILLAVLAVVMVIIDYKRNGKNASRWREYLFVLAVGLVATVYGMVNDFVTVSISSHYFTLGKGLSDGPGLAIRAVLLGSYAGFSAGLVGGAYTIFIATFRTKTKLPISWLFSLLWIPIVSAVSLAFLMTMLFSGFDPYGFRAELSGLITTREIDNLIFVWWIHVGDYLGLLVGLVIISVLILKKRKKAIVLDTF